MLFFGLDWLYGSIMGFLGAIHVAAYFVFVWVANFCFCYKACFINMGISRCRESIYLGLI